MIISTQHLMPPAGADPPPSAVPPPPPPEENPAVKIEGDPHAMAVDLPEGTRPAGPIEVIDVDEEKPPNLDFSQAPPPIMPPPDLSQRKIDVPFEASKLPLDVAIFNSARAAGGDDKIRKYLQAVLVIGGTASIPGMNHALESRLVPSPFLGRVESFYSPSPIRSLKVAGNCHPLGAQYGEGSNYPSSQRSRSQYTVLERRRCPWQDGKCFRIVDYTV